jgi:anhydro-N-acetylmuramic acid kinase
VGFHGQTVLHRAPAQGRSGRTRQLGDGALMARLLGRPVVFDFRSADMAAGGQGAPLSAVYHDALLGGLADAEGTAVLNLGGVANVTARVGDGLAAFDTGPANAPLNDFVAARGLGEMDRDGRLAAAGRVDRGRLAGALEHPFLARPYPKSLDRFDFGHDWVADLSDEDGAATLTAFTAAAVGRGLDLLPERPGRLIVCGGGRRNPTLMAMLETRAGVRAQPAEAAGWQGDAVEAQCFAHLAMRRLRGLPGSHPATTGAAAPTLAGRIAPPG